MRKIDVDSSSSKKCVVCNRKTPHSLSFEYVDGISINVPVCRECTNKTGILLNEAMGMHLKAIAQSIRMSTVITYDENYIENLKEREKHE